MYLHVLVEGMLDEGVSTQMFAAFLVSREVPIPVSAVHSTTPLEVTHPSLELSA